MALWQYKHGREHYAALFNVSVRTISRWAKDGLPLDDEAQTRALVATGAKFTPQLSGNRPRTPLSAATGALGLSGAVLRIAESEAAAYQEYQTALAGTDAKAVAILERRWLDLAEALRKNEVSNPEVAEANKNTIPVKEVEAALNDLFLKLRQDLETLPKRIALELLGRDEIGIREVLQRESAEIITALYACKYAGGSES